MDVSSAELDFFIQDHGRLASYLILREQILSLAPDAQIKVQKTTISFRAPRPFVYVSLPYRKKISGWPDAVLQISFSSQKAEGHPCVIHSTAIRAGLYTIHALVNKPGTLDDGLLDLIHAALHLRNK
ncbi:MAG: hypothetical protein GXZ04_01900 [Clostridiales bacterium]|nr:hypothetical protein [Clostridiales bacterium]